jgi:hypothetical protein
LPALFSPASPASAAALDQLRDDIAAGALDLLIHAGDFAYDLQDIDSANGNMFMNRAMTYSTSVPVSKQGGSGRAAETQGGP